MSDPTLADLIKQYIRNHGFKIEPPRMLNIVKSCGFDVWKSKTKLGTIDVDEKRMKIKLTLVKRFGDTMINASNDNVDVYDPDSFPTVVERLNAAFVLARQGDL